MILYFPKARLLWNYNMLKKKQLKVNHSVNYNDVLLPIWINTEDKHTSSEKKLTFMIEKH